jgi:hypothetical protein
MERRLKFIEKEILKNGIPILEPSYIPHTPNPLDTSNLKVSSKHIYVTREDVIEISDKLKFLMQDSYLLHPI